MITVKIRVFHQESCANGIVNRCTSQGSIPFSQHICFRNQFPLSISSFLVSKILTENGRSTIVTIEDGSITDNEYFPVRFDGKMLGIAIVHVIPFKVISRTTVVNACFHRVRTVFQFCERHVIGNCN